MNTLPHATQRRTEVEVGDLTLWFETSDTGPFPTDRRPRRAVVIELLEGPCAGWRSELGALGVARSPTSIVAARRDGDSMERLGTYVLESLQGDLAAYAWMERRRPSAEDDEAT